MLVVSGYRESYKWHAKDGYCGVHSYTRANMILNAGQCLSIKTTDCSAPLSLVSPQRTTVDCRYARKLHARIFSQAECLITVYSKSVPAVRITMGKKKRKSDILTYSR